MRTPLKLATFGAAIVILTVGAAPLVTSAADHLDAPSLGSLSVGSLQGDRDINDLYVFQADRPNYTVIALDTNPAAGLLAPATYGSNVRYRINVDTNGDAVADTMFDVTFGAPGSGPGSKQTMTVTKNGVVLGTGMTGNANQLSDGGKVFAGLRSDPFFFDLLGFRGSLGLGGSDRLCDGRAHPDFFANLNTLAIVLEVPDSELGTNIGVWATTAVWDGTTWSQRDQMGRPAINTVFNHAAQDKEDFNVTAPADQRTAFGGKFVTNVVGTLTSFGWDTPTATAIANFLIPDVLTYDTRTVANGAAFNGRGLSDDVIDAELAVTTHFNVTSDCVGPHTDYLSSFPYLGLPH